MRIRSRVILLLAPALFLIGQVPGQTVGTPKAPQKDIRELESLILGSSFREADRLAAKVLAAPGPSAQTLAVCGLAVLKAGRIAEAEAILDKAIALEPDNPEAHLGLGRIARIRNDRDAAVAHLRQALHSSAFCEEALSHLWRAAWDRGSVSDLFEIRDAAVARYGRESRSLPSWVTNNLSRIRGLEGRTLYAMEGRFEPFRTPLLAKDVPFSTLRMMTLKLNGKGEYPFDIDSAAPDFIKISPLLAEELGLHQTGSGTAFGVGTATAAVRYSVLDKVELGPVVFRNVPVDVSDIRPFRGRKKGLIGTAFLKRFNITIDAAANVMDLYPLEQSGLLASRIDRRAVAADVPLFLYDATTVEASVGGAPAALYILDSAAASHLLDGPFFEEHLKPKIAPDRISPYMIQGAGGAQSVNRVDGLTIALGGLVFDGQTMMEFPMRELNRVGRRYQAGLLGNAVLWPYLVHMDFRRCRLILEKRVAFEPEKTDCSHEP